METNHQALNEIPFFRELNAQEAERLSEIIIERSYRRKTTIFTEGSEKEAVFFIRDGLVKAYKTDENGNEQIVSFLKTGDLFPHTGFFNQTPYPATTETLVDSHLIAIPVRAFEQLMLAVPTIAVKVMAVMGAKIRELQEKLQQFTGQDVNDRALSFLLYLANKHGVKKGDNVYIDLPVTHQEFANSIGTTRETVNRLLNLLKKNELIETHRNEIIVLDFEGLKNFRHG